jgi:hypothetical protein
MFYQQRHSFSRCQRNQTVISLLRIVCCWQFVLAGLLVITPQMGVVRCVVVESSESTDTDAPAEESADPPEFDAAGRPLPARRLVVRLSPVVILRELQREPVAIFPCSPPAVFVEGHRLLNGLCAPLRC